MATKSKLEKAIEERISSLNAAQRELVRAQFEDYKRNKARIAEIDAVTTLINTNRVPEVDSAELLANRTSLSNERSTLVRTNNEIAAMLFDKLK